MRRLGDRQLRAEPPEATSTDEASLDSCAEQVAELACAEWLMNPAIDDCLPTGTLAADADCENDWDCASGVCYTASCREPGAEGEPCATGPRPCQNGLLCAQQVADEGTSATCQQQLEVGDPCDSDLSACPHPTVCLEGTCREPVMGTPCVDGRICGSRWRIGTCDTGNYSGACDGVCAPFTLVGNGDTCGQHLLCDATTYCSLGHLNFKGICQPRVEVGGSCEGEFNVLPPQCVAGARCGDGFICVSSL